MSNTWIVIGAVSAFISVMAGAFGAHSLSATLSPRMMEVFQTGVQYQTMHSLALIGFGLWCLHYPQAAAHFSVLIAGWAFVLGIVLFSGSLYGLALSEIKILGAITPLGGLSFLVGWASFALTVYRAS